MDVFQSAKSMLRWYYISQEMKLERTDQISRPCLSEVDSSSIEISGPSKRIIHH